MYFYSQSGDNTHNDISTVAALHRAIQINTFEVEY